jgi:hypothetical protein
VLDNSRMPVLLYGLCRVNDCAIHVEEEAIERNLYRRGGVVAGIVDATHSEAGS